jgi:protein TonB
MQVLAPEDDTPSMDALRSSLASDIVELIVLSTDEAFLQTLRDAVGPSRRLWHVLSSDKVGDLLLAGGVGILVLDVHALQQAYALFITQMKQQFPDLVIVVAGARDAETELARLISDGTVYRFIHKPMSPARARLFADAAVKRYEDQRRRVSAMAAAAATPPGRNGLVIAGACAALCAIAGGIWALTHSDRQNAPPPAADVPPTDIRPAPAPAADPRTAVTAADSALLARAAQALAADRLIAPAGDNALELYLQELARNPANAEARSGIAALRERLVARAQNALLEERLDEASAALDTARRAGADTGRIARLTAELVKARAHTKSSAESATAKAPAEADGASPSPDPAAPSAALALQRIQQGRLLEPETDSARFYLRQALKSNPGSAAAERASEALALGLLNAARGALDRQDFKAASSWLDGAEGIASSTNIDNLRQLLATAERQAREGDATPKAAEQTPDENRPAPDNGQAKAADVIDAGHLVLVKSVQPDYPHDAQVRAIEGWVEIEFTVAESGQVKNATVRAANPRGVFNQAAISALLQWRYKPVLVDARPVAQRARIRIRFALAK